MRFRFLGQHIHVSIAILAAIDAAVFFGAMVLAAVLRFWGDLGAIDGDHFSIVPRAGTYALVMLVSLLGFGLYSARQRARTFGIFVRVVAAIAVGTAVTAVIFYAVPALFIGRGVLAFAAGIAVLGACLTRVLFTRVVGDEVFKRRILVYGCGQRASAVAELRRRSDRRGFTVV